MNIFVVANEYGWGKGESLTEAMKNYTKYNHNMAKGQKYHLWLYAAPKMEDIQISDDGLELKWNSRCVKLYDGIETK